jgi:hypothetical protein
MTNHFELNMDELDAAVGGDKACVHGTGTCKKGDGDGLGQLRQIEGGLIDAGKAVASSLLSIIT